MQSFGTLDFRLLKKSMHLSNVAIVKEYLRNQEKLGWSECVPSGQLHIKKQEL